MGSLAQYEEHWIQRPARSLLTLKQISLTALSNLDIISLTIGQADIKFISSTYQLYAVN